MRNRKGLDFARHLNVSLSENPFFKTLFQVVNTHIEGTVGEQLAQLSRLRSALHTARGDWIRVGTERHRVLAVDFDFDGLETVTNITTVDASGQTVTLPHRAMHDRSILIASAKQAGFDYYSDTITDMTYLHVIEYAMEFWPENGSHDFIDFIGFIKHVRLQMQQLWANDTETTDAYQYLEPDYGQLRWVTDNGPHSPSSHYEVTYDYLSSPRVDVDDLVKLFYVFAPINFVLERLVGEINVDRYWTAIARPDLMLVDSGYLRI